MIIARSPLRITLGGGGTDLPSYYEKFGGFLIAAAIDRYVYITLHDTFVPDLLASIRNWNAFQTHHN
jgi:D-glycero-alpha-D-manno-heptose-7-phosphate kinase